MELKKQIIDLTIVILTRQLDPTVVNRYWLVNENIINDADILETSVFVPGMTKVETKELDLLILPDKILLSIKNNYLPYNPEKVLIPLINRLAEKIPNTIYLAMGLNYSWMIDGIEDIKAFGLKHFFKNDSVIHNAFNVNGDASFGSFMSKKHKGSIMQVEIRPSSFIDAGLSRECFLFAFNFHFDLNKAESVSIDAGIKCWSEFYREAEKVINLL